MRITSGQPSWYTKALLAVALVTLSACATSTAIPTSFTSPMPVAIPVQYTHTVYFPTGVSEIEPHEVARWRRFLAQLPGNQRLSARIIGYADERANDDANLRLSTDRAANVAALIRAAGPYSIEVGTVGLGRSRPTIHTMREADHMLGRRAEIVVTAYAVQLPACPNWSRDPAADPGNLPLSNLGCANAVNLGLMVADPRDLVGDRPFGAADGTREADAIARYRADKVKKLEADELKP